MKLIHESFQPKSLEEWNYYAIFASRKKYYLKQFDMKKLLSWGFAAAMICGLNVFSSCINDNDDNPVDPADHLAEKIIGKWMIAAVDGQRSTNGKGGVSATCRKFSSCRTRWPMPVATMPTRRPARDIPAS